MASYPAVIPPFFKLQPPKLQTLRVHLQNPQVFPNLEPVCYIYQGILFDSWLIILFIWKAI